jgi:cytochrome P450
MVICALKKKVFNIKSFEISDELTIPRGVNVLIRIIDVHRRREYWGDDADVFKPERHLPESFAKVHPYAYIPFSNGNRICIGHRYTMNVMKITLSYILRKYCISTDLKFEEIKLEISFILRIAQHYMIRLTKRNI